MLSPTFGKQNVQVNQGREMGFIPLPTEWAKKDISYSVNLMQPAALFTNASTLRYQASSQASHLYVFCME